jgi:hypothetical protein
MNFLKFLVLIISLQSINSLFFRKNVKETLEYGRSFAKARAVSYAELAEKQRIEKEMKEKIFDKKIEKKVEKNLNLTHILLDL